MSRGSRTAATGSVAHSGDLVAGITLRSHHTCRRAHRYCSGLLARLLESSGFDLEALQSSADLSAAADLTAAHLIEDKRRRAQAAEASRLYGAAVAAQRGRGVQ